MPRNRSSYFDTLERSRVILNPSELLCRMEPLLLDHAALGILIRLLARAAGSSLPKDLRLLARLVHVHIKTLRKHWPKLAPIFVEQGDRLTPRESDWFAVQTVAAPRQSLRHLLDTLVTYWGSACAYCGTEDGQLEIEHIVPVVRGGSDDLTNLTLACRRCNSEKRTKTAAEFGHPHVHDIAARIQ